MPAYEYQALDLAGKKKKGIIEADSPRQVRQQLKEKSLAPVSVSLSGQKHRAKKEGPTGGSGSSLGSRDLALITRQLATLVQSAIPIEEALTAVASQSEKAKIRGLILAVRSKVLEGYSLADSLTDFPNAFPKLYRSTVAAGEHAGHLDLVLLRLADYTEARQQARQKIQLAAIYPVILTFVAIAIVVFLLAYVVPDIIKVFINNGQALPPLTAGLLSLSDFLSGYGLYILIALITGFGLFRYMMRKRAFRLAFDKRILHFPLTRKISRGSNAARFASTISILNSSGVPLVDAMRIAGEVLSNEYLKEQVKHAAQKVSEGSSLHKALDASGYFPPMMVHMIASGEASGELDQMLERTAKNQEFELEGLISTMVGLFEPLMLLVMGAVILLIVLAIMLPILNMSSLVG